MSLAAAALVERASGLGCQPGDTTAEDESAGVLATATCQPPADDVTSITLQDFEDADTLRTAWQSSLATTSSLDTAEDACRTSEPGRRKWGFGNIACTSEDGVARILWTDSRTETLGVIESTVDDIPAVHQWWRANARRLGRVDDPAATPTAPSTPEATPRPAGRKVVRVPGKPRAISCAATDTPIPDEWNRSWRIARVEFQNRAGYERVILNLERTGKNRTGTPTRAQISRMSVARAAEAVPKTAAPTRGRVAIVVDLDGVRGAPRLIRFKPKSIDLVKQMSIVKSVGGRTVVLSAPQGTCYQMRIPVWGANARGNEKKAEIFIDLAVP